MISETAPNVIKTGAPALAIRAAPRPAALRIFLHEYAGHAYAIQLSRQLAKDGHHVVHAFFRDFQTPKGDLAARPDDGATLHILDLTLDEPFCKTALWRRRAQEIRYGRLVAREIKAFRPDIVISSNTPLDTQAVIQRAARQAGAPFVFWVQDLYGDAIMRILRARLGLLGLAVGRRYQRLESALLGRSDQVVVISPDFAPLLTKRGLAPQKISVVENWAALSELPRFGRENAWTRRANFADQVNVVYAGTLGYKHDPSLLLDAARQCPDAIVSVFSEGEAAEGLARQAQRAGVRNLHVRPWVAFFDLPQMLAAADLVVALIEPEAGRYSVPSKVLSYLAAGKPILASIPADNLAARLIVEAGAGRVVSPGDRNGFVAACRAMLADPAARHRAGQAGRAYAERTFAITAIAARFTDIMAAALRSKPR